MGGVCSTNEGEKECIQVVGGIARGFHKMLGNYRVSYQLGISRVMLSSIELVRMGTHKLCVHARPSITVILQRALQAVTCAEVFHSVCWSCSHNSWFNSPFIHLLIL
jgi:hypothetical protein